MAASAMVFKKGDHAAAFWTGVGFLYLIQQNIDRIMSQEK
jgi:hypothetical protein